MAAIFRIVVALAAVLATWGLSHLNGPVRLAGPFNLPDPLPPLAVVLAAALAAFGARRTGWGARGFGIVLLAAAALLVAGGVVNDATGSPDGGRWGDRYVRADPEWSVALYAVAFMAAALGAALMARRPVR